MTPEKEALINEQLNQQGLHCVTAMAYTDEQRRLERLDAMVWNYLGLRDPDEVGTWLRRALSELNRRSQ